MSRTLQWVIGISVVVVSLALVFVLIVPMMLSWIGRGTGFGMMSPYSSGAYRGNGMMGGYGMMGGRGMTQAPAPWAGVGGGMMGGWSGTPGGFGSSARLSLDQARTLAEEYAAAAGADLTVTEVMEFENNFYAVVEEAGTGRAAFELLIDPYSGAVGPEPGPNMMWNDKYGHMSFGLSGGNALSLDAARAQAQQALEAQLPGAVVHEDGADFYGYYTFDFDGPDGVVAGMLSVDAASGAVWLHTWHGDFIGEWESDEGAS
jgi:hypothetical protein